MKWPSRRVLWGLVVVGLLLVVFGTLSAGVFLLVTPIGHRDQTMITDLQLGLKSFHLEYGHWPRPDGAARHKDVDTTLAGPILASLLGDPTTDNVRGIVFIEPRDTTNSRRGLARFPDGQRLLDHWGLEYRVLMDGDGDGAIANPDLGNWDPGIRAKATRRPTLPGPAVMGAGEDGVWLTPDDITSWRPRSSTSTIYQLNRLLTHPSLVIGLGLVACGLFGLFQTRRRTRPE